jgi:hypothetical protein
VHRLASLFWRLRRATAIETGLLRMQAEILSAFRSSRPKMAPEAGGDAEPGVPPFARHDPGLREKILDSPINTQDAHASVTQVPVTTARAVAVSFLRLANLDNDIVDRLSRYEAALWRQLAQTLFTLQALKRR